MNTSTRSAQRALDFDDIQAFVLRGYSRPEACYAFVNVQDAAAGRAFVTALAERITTVREWDAWEAAVDKRVKPKPKDAEADLARRRVRRDLQHDDNEDLDVAWNVSISYPGLVALGVPEWVRNSFPIDFREGMKARARLLGDVGQNGERMWDRAWQGDTPHLWVGLAAVDQESLDQALSELEKLVHDHAGVHLLPHVQEATSLRRARGDEGDALDRETILRKEHFGFDDGIGQPDIEGAGHPRHGSRDWRADPIKAGEFLLGHPDETLELPPAPLPHELAHNGTFMVYRKLHQNVFAFRRFLQAQGGHYGAGWEELAGKMVGRKLDGTPMVQDFDGNSDRDNSFRYDDDKQGTQCPFGSHIRRTNPRNSLDPDGLIASRHRIIRRGKPYGLQVPGMEAFTRDLKPSRDHLLDDLTEQTDFEERGVILIALNASISRQFEFIQREWINAGSHVWQGRHTDPLIGNHGNAGRFMIQNQPNNGAAAPGGRDASFVCAGIPQFVELRGGGYFFMPGLAALQLLGSGRFDDEH